MKREPKHHPSDIEATAVSVSDEQPRSVFVDPDLQSGEMADPSAESANGLRQSTSLPENAGSVLFSASDIEKQPSETKQQASARKAAARERKKLKADQKISTVMVAIFFGFALAISIFLLAAPRSATSKIERRSLAQWPAFTIEDYFSGTYTSSITEYYDDTVPARDTMKNLGSRFRSLYGITSEESVEVIGSIRKADDAAPAAAAVSEAETTVYVPAEAETTTINSKDYHIENQDVIDENGYLVVLQDGHWRGFSLYVGVDCSLYADTVNYIRQMVDPSINIYVMPAPLAAQFYIPANYLEYHMDMRDSFRDLSSKLISGITPVDVIDVLDSHNTENIYLRTDHHWAYLAAYYAAGELAKAAGVPYADLDTYEKNVREGYVGTMYALTGSANLLNDPEDFEYYIPSNSYIVDYYDQSLTFLFRKGLFFNTDLYDSYCVALGEDDIIIHIRTDAGNGRKLVVIKDSYGNATVPFLTSSFEEIYVIDQRYFDFNLIDFINKTGATDILFCHDYYSLSGAEAELMEYITYSNLDSEVTGFVPEAELPEEGNPDLNGSDILFAEDVLGYTPEPRYEEEDWYAEDDYEEDTGWDGETFEKDAGWDDESYEEDGITEDPDLEDTAYSYEYDGDDEYGDEMGNYDETVENAAEDMDGFYEDAGWTDEEAWEEDW